MVSTDRVAERTIRPSESRLAKSVVLPVPTYGACDGSSLPALRPTNPCPADAGVSTAPSTRPLGLVDILASVAITKSLLLAERVTRVPGVKSTPLTSDTALHETDWLFIKILARRGSRSRPRLRLKN